MLKRIIGALIYKIAPIHSGARYSQNLAAKISNPPLLLPMPIAREISSRCYRTAEIVSKRQGRPVVLEFEPALDRLTVLAVDYIQGAYDNEFMAKESALRAHPWLKEAIDKSGINAVGISRRPTLVPR